MFTRDAICLSIRTNYHARLKCLPSAHMHIFNGARHWSIDLSIVQCCAKTIIFITERHDNATNKILLQYYKDVSVSESVYF